MKPRKGVDAEVLLRYGSHTAECATRDLVADQRGEYVPANKACNCGWEKLKLAFETELPLHIKAKEATT